MVAKKATTKDQVMRFRMDEKLQTEVERIAQELDRSQSWIIRKALEEYVERYSKGTRKS
jgi:predicted transcriptional regulator